MNISNIPSFAKKATISSIGIASIVCVAVTIPVTILSLGVCAIIGIVTCYCVHIQYLTDITGKAKNK
jgi:predicted RND superfamily exporter protein